MLNQQWGGECDFSQKSILVSRIAMVCAGRAQSKTAEINEWELVGNSRVSGHPKRTSSDGDTTSQSQ